MLANPAVYDRLQRLVGSARVRVWLQAEVIRAREGDSVLDIGCGTADILAFLPRVSYVGFDANPRYIAAAQRRFAGRGTFNCGTVSAAVAFPRADLVLALGVLHHLTDAEAGNVFRIAKSVLKPGGRLVTFDGCHVPRQPLLARILLALDRGRYVRTAEAYVRLARTAFEERQCKVIVRNDLLRVPYNHCILACTA